MQMDEEEGYALASWTRFEGELTDDLARAITSAFVLVACADGDLAAEEVTEFEHTLESLQADLPGLDFSLVRRLFTDICGAVLSDPTSGRAHALAAIESVKDNPEQAELVKSAAKIAMNADNRQLARETSAWDVICTTLDSAHRPC